MFVCVGVSVWDWFMFLPRDSSLLLSNSKNFLKRSLIYLKSFKNISDVSVLEDKMWIKNDEVASLKKHTVYWGSQREKYAKT